jgi:hypothetical protein
MTLITAQDQKKRPSAASLLMNPFLTKNSSLEKEPLDYTLNEPGKAILFRYHLSTVLDGIICKD